MKIQFLKDYTDERGRGFRVGDIVSDDAYTRLPMHSLLVDGTAALYPLPQLSAPKPEVKKAKKAKKKPSSA